MVNESSCGGVTLLERATMVMIAWILELRPTDASGPTSAVSMIMNTNSCQRSWPTRAQTNTTMNDEIMVPNGIISAYRPLVMGSEPVNSS